MRKGSGRGQRKGEGRSQFYGQCYHSGELGRSQNWCPNEHVSSGGLEKGKGWRKTGRFTSEVEEEAPHEYQGLGELGGKRQCWVLDGLETRSGITSITPIRPGTRDRYQVLQEVFVSAGSLHSPPRCCSARGPWGGHPEPNRP